ncbi:hypothetical protein WG904_07095, partial [Pedobacter sp. Du54]|uniref:beta strand repeat-containing protein n=1 Tax=Pedobacter anseongensis TaxID=3133439 RepID=UPI0030B3FBAB
MNSLPNSSHSVALGIFIPSFSRFLLKFNFTKRYALALCATIILLFTTGRANGQTQFWSDTFEDTNAPSAGTRTASLNTGGPSVPYAYYFLRTDGTNLNLQAPFPGDNFTTYQNVQGSKFWAGEDTDRVRSGVTDVNDKVQKIEWTGINISGKSGMSFKGLFASHRSMGWQNIVFGATYDFLRVEYSIDGGAWTRIGSFVGDASSTNAGYLKEDTDDNKIGDGTELNKTFQEFSWPITGTGTTMSLRFTVSADASATQEFAIDNFRLFESAAPAPSFTAQPSNSSVCAGSNSTFSVTASNATSYQWQVSTNGGSTFNALSNNSPYSGVTTTTLTITGATAGLNAYQYKCVATGSGSATSNAATLTVNSAPSISSHPVNSTLCAGSNTTFGVTASNALSYQWQVDQGAGFSNITNNATYSGATTSTLTITAASASLSGYSYRVIATGTCSPVAASSAATLIVNAAPNISSHPSNSSITAGSSTTFTTTASGVTSYQWQINTGSGFSNITNGAPYSGATTATLTISNATVGLNSYQYRVIASGTCTPAATSNAATLTVASAGTLETFPSIGNNASAFTNGVSGMKYTFTGSLHGTIYANLGHNADDFIVSNDGNCLSAAGTVGSIKSATAGYMKIKSLWVFPSSNCNTVTNGGAVTFTGRKSGVDVYTVTLPSASINTLQSNNQGFTLVDFSSTANGNSNVTNIEVDEIMVAVGGTLRYAAIDDITYTFAPLTQSTNVSFASTTTTTSTASWVNGTGTSRAVFMRAASSGTATPVNNTTYTANAIFGSGTQIGATGWFCVYKGTGTSVNITGLTAGTSYQVMTIEYNGAVGSEQYQTTTATNNPTTLTTTAAPVAVSLSTSPTLTFTSGDGMSTMAVDGNGNSATISDLDLQIFAGDKSTGVYSTGATMRWENDQYLSSPNGFNGITPGPDPATTLNGFSALVIKSSSQAANFSLKSIQLQDWGAVGPVRIAGYNNGTLVGFVSTTLPSNGDGVTKNQSGELTPAYFNDIDEVRIFSNSVNIYVAVNNIQVGTPIATAVPTITSATYNASTGVLAVTGANMITGDTIDPTKLSIAGQGGSYTLTSGNVTASSATAVSITLNAADRLNINGILNNNGTSAVDVTAYNLAAAANWNATTTSAADLTGNAITVSNVSAPTITSATYDASTNVLSVTGTGLVKTVGATNDITVSKLTITGNNGITRTLTTTGNVEVTSATSFSVTLSGADIAAVSALLNKNGISSISNTTYNLSAADDWNSVITGGNIADLIANGITVSNVSITGPTASANAQTNVLCFGGSNGSATVLASGGTGPYTYSWAPSGGTAATATGLVAGTYTVTVTDANNLQATQNFTITEPASAISLTAGSQTNISCFGGSNGTASVSPTGGTPGYTYSWAPSGGTAATATGLVAGS